MRQLGWKIVDSIVPLADNLVEIGRDLKVRCESGSNLFDILHRWSNPADMDEQGFDPNLRDKCGSTDLLRFFHVMLSKGLGRQTARK